MEPPLPSAGRARPPWQRELLERKRAKRGGGPPEERRAPAERGARPLRELLELYSAVPGIRTIRADNILIIESRPGAPACFAPGEPPPARAEIRAARVLVYEPAAPGRVSRLLQKFDPRPAPPAAPPARRGHGPPATPRRAPSSPNRRAPSSPVSAAAPWPVPAAPASSPNRRAPSSPNRRAPSSPGSTAAPWPAPPSPSNRRAPSSPLRTAAPERAPAAPASPPNRRAPSSPVSTAAPWPAPAAPASPPNRRAPSSPNRRAPSSPLSTAAPWPAPASPPNRRAPAAPASPPNRRAPSSSVSTAAPWPVPAAPASPPNQRAPSSLLSTAALQRVPAALDTSRASGFLHRIGSNSFTVTPRGLRQDSGALLMNGPLEHRASPGDRSLQDKAPPVPSPSVSVARANTKPKPERREEIQPPQPSATPSSGQLLSASALRDRGSFKICPAPKPDLATIPAHDLQAQALASLRLNSRNSFLFVPRRGGGPCLAEPAETVAPLKPECEQQEELITPPQVSPDLLVPVTYIDDDIVELDAGGLPQEMGPAVGLKDSEQPQEATSALGTEATGIPLYKPHPGSSSLQQRVGNTFTIVPKRKPHNTGKEVDRRTSGAQQPEEQDEESSSKGKTLGSPGAPLLDLGPLLKKRYPTVHEIEVIGGYLSLEKSCMSKTDSRRKKMKISFNETSLQTMFEYPSENSLMEEGEEESVSEGEEDDEEDKPFSLYIPRPTSTMVANVPSSGFSSYTPKHSVEFSKWQEQEYEKPATAAGPLLKERPPGNQVMLTPAEQSGLSDFSSEPALYF